MKLNRTVVSKKSETTQDNSGFLEFLKLTPDPADIQKHERMLAYMYGRIAEKEREIGLKRLEIKDYMERRKSKLFLQLREAKQQDKGVTDKVIEASLKVDDRINMWKKEDAKLAVQEKLIERRLKALELLAHTIQSFGYAMSQERRLQK